MREGSVEGRGEDERPIYVASVRRDGRLRGDWQEAAEAIAHIEGGIALSRREELGEAPLPAEDGIEPGFIMVGSRRGLAAVAETAIGIIEHGQAFRAWADLVGDDPEDLRLFESEFLGGWDSAAEFAGELLAERAPLREGAPECERATDAALLASELADELERRGELRAVPRPAGGVWLFRSHKRTASLLPDAAEERGEHE